MKLNNQINVVVAGVGGQGNIVASKILTLAAREEGFKAVIGEVYGLSQRGGSVVSHIRISTSEDWPPLIPEGKLDILLGLEPLEALRHLCLLGNRNTSVILNPNPVYSPFEVPGKPYPDVKTILNEITSLVKNIIVFDAKTIAEGIGAKKFQNIVMLGVLASSGYLPIKKESFEKIIQEFFKDEKNLLAFKSGFGKA